MQISIKTLNANTTVDLVDGIPDLRNAGSLRILLQNAFDAGNYTIVNEPEFVSPEPLPDWKKFITFMDSEGLFNVGYQQNFPVFSQLFNMVLKMRDDALPLSEDYVEWRNFKACYQIGVYVFTQAQLASVEQALIDSNVPRFW